MRSRGVYLLIPAVLLLTCLAGAPLIYSLTGTRAADAVPAEEGESWVEGVLAEVSELPDPRQSDYPDCYYTARFIANGIADGNPAPQEFLLVIPGFFDYENSPFAGLEPSRKYKVRILPFEQLPAQEQSIQQADDLMLFELESYVLRDAAPIEEFKDHYAINFSSCNREYTSIYDRNLNPPATEEAAAARAAAMRTDLERMDRYIAAFEADKAGFAAEFQAGLAELSRRNPDRVGANIWSHVDGAFWSLPMDYRLALAGREIPDHNLAALKHFSEMLEANGTHLIIQVIPIMREISARVMVPAVRDVPDIQSAVLVRQLLANGIEAMYCSDRLLAGRSRHPFMFFYPDDAHPADGCQDILTDMLVERLACYEDCFRDDTRPEKFSEAMKPTVYGDKYAWPAGCDIGDNLAGERILCRHILYDGQPLEFNPDAGVLVIGNSYIKTPEPRASYGSYLARKLNYIPDVVRVDMYGPVQVILKNFVDRPERFIHNKRVVVLPVSVWYLLSDISFVDVKLLDDMKRSAGNKKLLRQLELPQEELERLPVEDHQRYIDGWRTFCREAKIQRILPEAKQSYEVCEIDLPPESPGKDRLCSIAIAAYRLQTLNVTLGGVSATVIPNHFDAEWQLVTLPVPAGGGPAKITVSAPLPDTVFAIRDISIFETGE